MRVKETYDQVPIRVCNLKVGDIFLHYNIMYKVKLITIKEVIYENCTPRKAKGHLYNGLGRVDSFGIKSQQLVTLLW